MEKNRIRLTEDQLHGIIKGSIKKILREGSSRENGINALKELRKELNDDELLFAELFDFLYACGMVEDFIERMNE